MTHRVAGITLAMVLFASMLSGCGGESATQDSAGGGYATIFEAARASDVAAVKQFLKQGATVNDRDAEGRTPLHYAAAYGDNEMVNFLIQQGADVNATDSRGMTPMRVAAQMGNSIAEEALDRAGGRE